MGRVKVSVLRAVLAGIVGCAVVSCGRQPHVIVISFDTTRADSLGCYGNTWIETPHIDKFAEESILFDACMSVAPTTLASHTSLLTGTYPHTHGVPRNGFMVDSKNVMFAEVLHDAGYHTAGFTASFTLSDRFDIDQGFDRYDRDYMWTGNESDWQGNERSAEAVTDAVLDHLDKAAQAGETSPMFLFVHYWDPHIPYRPPSPYLEKYLYREGEAGPEQFSNRRGEASASIERRAEALGEPIPDYANEVDDYDLISLHAGEISYMDEHVGRLFRGLRDRDMYEESIVAVTSDHGESLLQHEPYFTHGWDTYQANVGVACIVRLPGGWNGGTRVSVPISNIDVMPSVLGYLGLAVPERVEGRTIDFKWPDEDTPERLLYSQATKPFDSDVEDSGRWPNMDKTRGARWRNFTFMQFPLVGKEELYDLAGDPMEQHNLLDDPTPDITQKTAAIRSELERWADSADPLPVEYESDHQDDTINRLKELGYIGG